jgi:23S rRNA (adenine2503-C2)-methyltransferase
VTTDTTDIKALTPAGLAGLMEELGQPRYRADQVAAWLYGKGVTAFGEMTDLSAQLRAQLTRSFFIGSSSIVRRQVSELDGTRKYLVRAADGTEFETVGLPAGDRLTVCFSTQAGCGMGCSFCATGAGGLERSLSAGEIVDQVRLVATDMETRVTNAVAMGQGEPFANYDATIGALRFINSPKGLGIGARHLTVSTCGIVPGILRLSEEPEQFTLAVSLHSAVQATRDGLMPAVRRWPLTELRSALVEYATRTGRRPTLEYALIEGVNVSDEELAALVSFCSGMLVHVNLIPMNPVAGSGLERARAERVGDFARALRRAGVEPSERVERGADIQAACGQLKRGA